MNTLKEKLIRINRYDAKVSALYSEIATKLGLSDSEFDILYALSMLDGNAQIKDVCFFSCLKKQTVNSALRKMEKDKVLYLEAINGKSKLVKLTEKGQELMAMTVQRFIEQELSIISEWKDEELRTFIDANEKYLARLEEKIKEL